MNPITEVKIGAALLFAVLLFAGGLLIGYKFGHGAAERMALQNQKATILEYESRLKDQNTIFATEQAKLQAKVDAANAQTSKWLAASAALELKNSAITKQIGEIKNEKLRPTAACRDTADFERLYNGAAGALAVPTPAQAGKAAAAGGVHDHAVGPVPLDP